MIKKGCGILNNQIISKVMKNIECNNMKAYYAEKKENVIPIVKSILKEGMTVTVGGSVTLKECGILDMLNSGNYDYLDRYEEGLSSVDVKNIFRKASFADCYLSSTNAITENGELYNVDGNSNRISSIAHGPDTVIIIAGINKIVKDIDEAIIRVKTIAAPMNAKRLNRKTHCALNGECVSMLDENKQTVMCAGCGSQDRICCNYMVSTWQRVKDRINVILVGEKLGY